MGVRMDSDNVNEGCTQGQASWVLGARGLALLAKGPLRTLPLTFPIF